MDIKAQQKITMNLPVFILAICRKGTNSLKLTTLPKLTQEEIGKFNYPRFIKNLINMHEFPKPIK
jgi:hypothetical protein